MILHIQVLFDRLQGLGLNFRENTDISTVINLLIERNEGREIGSQR